MERTASLFRMSKLAANKSQLNTPLSNNDDSDNSRGTIRLSEKGQRPVAGFAFAGLMESFKLPAAGAVFEKGADLDS